MSCLVSARVPSAGSQIEIALNFSPPVWFLKCFVILFLKLPVASPIEVLMFMWQGSGLPALVSNTATTFTGKLAAVIFQKIGGSEEIFL